MSLAADLDRLWSGSDSPPNPESWFREVVTTVSAEELLAALKLDQQRRWKTAAPWPVEEYLQRLPLPVGLDWRFELAVGEFETRRESERPLSVVELSSRFPDLSDTLRKKLAISTEAEPPATVSRRASELTLSSTYITALGIQVGQRGRYRLDRVLGEGAFGCVYLGYDTELLRQVAVKVPKAERFKSAADADQYLQEARLAAALKHPQIVAVYDVGRTEDQSIYVVSQYIEGGNLKELLEQKPLLVRKTVEIIRDIAQALHHAHQRRLIHRDIKPANILIEAENQKAWVCDFGLAIREDDYLHRGGIAGTPAYMSPEQIRGEGHRLDGRSDLFSLGVIFYELLTGTRPFRSRTEQELRHEVTSVNPPQPRSLKPEIPVELERICMKAMAKRASDRYHTAEAFAEDLLAWLQPQIAPIAAPQRTMIKPKGLRSFDANDAHFFLELLPGTPDRDGLPDSITFWKQRIEERDAAKTFSVGLIYGPSGCGKSSLVKAGLLPHLSQDIVAIYLEATPQETELRICTAVRRRLPDLPAEGGIIELLKEIRRNPGPKVTIFLDQFEQWLLGHGGSSDSPLVQALRHCDGGRLQVVLMIRDDFIVSVTRLMQQLETPILQQQNSALVDLFDLPHAKAVLRKFGSAYGRLPELPAELRPDQQQFVDAIAGGLAENNRVISVRLALFAEMIREREWVPDTLQEVGGTSGIGVSFLDETFSNPRSDARYRIHVKAVRCVLKALLPGIDTEIKGAMKSVRELREAAEYADRPREFNDLLQILDGELRLITPTDLEGHGTPSRDATSDDRCYQLTHDYLVPSLRTWLTRKQAETPQGRAELLLEERASVWQSRQEDRQLPSLMEYVRIRRYVSKNEWTATQRALMTRAGRRHRIRTSIVGILSCLLIAASLLVRAKVTADQEAIRINGLRDRAESLSDAISTGRTSALESTLNDLQSLREYALPHLQPLYQRSEAGSEARLHLAVARLKLGDPDSALMPEIRDMVLQCRPEQLLPLTGLLQPWSGELFMDLKATLHSTDESPGKRLNAACLLAGWESAAGEGTAWANPQTAEFVALQLAVQNPVYVGQYQEVLRPQAKRLTAPLAALFTDPQQGEVARTIITGLLAEYAKTDAVVLSRMLLDADPTADQTLFPLLAPLRDAAIREFHAVLDRKLSPQWPDKPLDPTWQVPAAEVKARIEVASGLITDRMALCLDIPLSQLLPLLETLRASGYRPTRLRPHAGQAADDPEMSVVWVRDGGRFAVQTGLKPEDLPQPDANAERDGLLLADLVLIPGTGPRAGWLTLWSEAVAAEEQRRCAWGLSGSALETLQEQLAAWKFTAQLSLQACADGEGTHRFAAVFSNTGPPSETMLEWSGFERIDSPQRDLSAGSVSTPELTNPVAAYRIQLLQMLALPEEQLQQPQIRLERATAFVVTDQPELALVELDWLKENLSTPDATVLQLRTQALAQLERTEEATAAFADFQKVSPLRSQLDYVDIQLAAWRKDAPAARAVLDAAVKAHQENGGDLYKIARGAALAARAFTKQGAESDARAFQNRAVELLQKSLDSGYADAEQLQSDPDFADLHDDTRFLDIVLRLVPNVPFAGVWCADSTVETRLIRASVAADILPQLQPLLADAWRPVVSAIDSGSEVPQTLVLLQRPLIPEAAQEALARQQAAAAVALLRLQATEKVWPVLQDSPDPRVRSEVLHRLPRFGLDPQTLVTQLAVETDAGRRRALIQGLGELAAGGLITDAMKPTLINDLLSRYSGDPDSGVHGMCEWTLRQLGAVQQMVQIQREFAKGEAVGDRRWYLTKTGGATDVDTAISMAIVDATEEFVMGSPLSESGRYGGADSRPNLELQHRRRIDRVFAIGMQEITVAQFLRFRRNYDWNRDYSREEDAPANSISWYDAAAFCNWLSREEGLPSDQWCYEPDQQFANEMRIRPNYLKLAGYRLPTEAEWERACRCGTKTSRFYGSGESLLGDYAWYTTNSGDSRMVSVGTLRPNGYGLFGLYGNAFEWCQDTLNLFPAEEQLLFDEEQIGVVVDNDIRVLRGGSFFDSATFLRSSYRNDVRPGSRDDVGFRVSRTYHLRP